MITETSEPTKLDAPKAEPLGPPLVLALLATFVQRLAFAVSEVLLVFYLAALVLANVGITLTEVGILSAVLYVTQVLAAPPLGSLTDRLGRKRVLLLCIAGGLVATLIPPLTAVFLLLAINRVLAGAANMGSTPAGLALITDATTSSPARRGRAVTLYEGLGLAAQVGGVVIASVLWQVMQQASFYAAVALFFAALLLVALTIQETHKWVGDGSAKAETGVWMRLLRTRQLWAFAPIWIAANAILGLWYTYTAVLLLGSQPVAGQVLVGSLNGQTITAGLVFLGYGAVYGVGLAYWSGRVIPGARVRIMLIASGSVVLVCTTLAIFNHSAGAAWAWLLLLPAAIGQLGQSGFVPAALAYLTDLAEHQGGVQNRGAVLGFFSTGNSLGNVLGVVFGLIFIQWLGLSFDGLLLGSIVLAVIAFFAALPLLKGERAEAKSPQRGFQGEE